MTTLNSYLDALQQSDREIVEAYFRCIDSEAPFAAAAQTLGMLPGEYLRRLQAPEVHAVFHRCLAELREPSAAAEVPQVVIDARYVLDRLVDVVEFRLSEFATVDAFGNLKLDVTPENVHLIDDLAGVELETDSVPGSDGGLVRRKARLRPYDRLKALQMLGAHVEVQAWLQRHQVESVGVEIDEIRAGRNALAHQRKLREQETLVDGEFTEVEDDDS